MAVPTIVLLHIPKTAGTSIAAAMIRNLGAEHCIHYFASLPAELTGQKFIFSHYSYPEVDAIRGDKVYITCVRDPVERIVSHYRYISSLTEHHARANNLDFVLKTRAQTFEQYIMDSERIDNEIVRLFCGRYHDPAYPLGSGDLEVALANLDICEAIFSTKDLRRDFAAATGFVIGEENVTATNYRTGSGHERAPDVDLTCLSGAASAALDRLTALDQLFVRQASAMGAARGFEGLRRAIRALEDAAP